MSDDRLVEFAAILDEFAAGQRAVALTQTAKQRIIWSRTIGRGGQNVSFEAVIDQNCEAAEMNRLLDAMAAAGDRQDARVQLDEHMRQLRLDEANLDREKAAYRKRFAEITMEIEQANTRPGRRQQTTMSKQQRDQLEGMQTSFREAEAQIEERKLTIDECKRIIAGQTRIEAVEETQRKREAAARKDEAA